MKRGTFDNVFKPILLEHKPKTIGEIGCHRGYTALQILEVMVELGQPFSYTGYDAFELGAPEEFQKKEKNGKGFARYKKLHDTLSKFYRKNGMNFTFMLIPGLTKDSLVQPVKYDFVFIDGGHSYETVKHDYEMVKESKIILFDDYQLEGVQRFVDELPMEKKLISNDKCKHKFALIIN